MGAGPIGLIPPSASIDDSRWWQGRGLWAIDTVNASSWGSLKDLVLMRSQADIVCAQEARILQGDHPQIASNEARRAGWSMVVGQAKKTQAGRASGGCLVAARRGIGITDEGQPEIASGMAHRVKVAWLSAVWRGGLHLISWYPTHSIGAVDEDIELMAEVAALLAAINGPRILCGGCNMTQ